MSMPVEFTKFADIFPPDGVKHHFVGQDQARGIYAKELHIPAGFVLWTHRHAYDHLSVLASGEVILEVSGIVQRLTGPCAVTIRAATEHTLRAVTDTVWFCIHPSDDRDPDAVDAALIVREAV